MPQSRIFCLYWGGQFRDSWKMPDCPEKTTDLQEMVIKLFKLYSQFCSVLQELNNCWGKLIIKLLIWHAFYCKSRVQKGYKYMAFGRKWQYLQCWKLKITIFVLQWGSLSVYFMINIPKYFLGMLWKYSPFELLE